MALVRLGAVFLCLIGISVAGLLKQVRAQSASVSIQGFDFVPGAIVVAPGTTVAWVHNDGDAGHNVSLPGVFRSPGMYQGETFSHTFDTPGSYAYGCSLHPTLMTGIVTVGGAPPRPPSPPTVAGATVSPAASPATVAPTPTATVTPSPTIAQLSPTAAVAATQLVEPTATAQRSEEIVPSAPSMELAEQEASTRSSTGRALAAVTLAVMAISVGGFGAWRWRR